MEKLELRARARAAARASGLFDYGRGERAERRIEPRGRSVPSRPKGSLPPPVDAIDEAQARAACAPMGELEYIVQAADAEGRVRSLYVIVPDLSLEAHYERMGFRLEAGCRVLLDAAALTPIAVLRVSPRMGEGAPECPDTPAGYNPYFDLPPA
jgi:hypothetical protein